MAATAAAIKKAYIIFTARVKLVGKITDPEPQGVVTKKKKKQQKITKKSSETVQKKQAKSKQSKSTTGKLVVCEKTKL